jgi:hypothetical protein
VEVEIPATAAGMALPVATRMPLTHRRAVSNPIRVRKIIHQHIVNVKIQETPYLTIQHSR